ncbi:M16 family metallopeptidase [Stackebrandtia nassauensis]|uniref:Peptidase M16 domain protein n=1 Tax=Stackebrandtia nassauensis (strain DSM 44728 / CIP 108903 / NRRL B-16338 / NBRC 102104 / LLR-40K-21) TaxID=446470 RepID=D3PYA5_STANL|nr:pitrilysin family protein [Stackebrandtia nassauensis]ADD41472.1 peptidase M16 domain protein [Stackebrandtia nassauensis DSM 44728]
MTSPQQVDIRAAAFPVEQYRLSNGLRVVLSPDRGVPVVAVAVVYDIGIRLEPQGRTGFAHLFEHLMFQGSANVAKMEHMSYVQGSGGTLNGSTHLDYTDYYEMLPSNALERALFLEADRMRGPAITEENLANQVDVVKEEIRVNVLNRPYGGFPWLKLPPVMFDTFPNAHDGYGSFADLEAATVADAQSFFDTYYTAGNAVLTVAGDFDVAEATAMIERHFADVPGRPAPAHPGIGEPDLTSERRHAYTDPRAPLPAIAAAWRVPDPVKDTKGYLPYVVLAELLTDGDASRLVERMIQKDRTATSLGGYVGFMGEPFAVRDPTALLFQAHLPPGGEPERVLATVDEELRRLASDGLAEGELERVKARIATHVLREDDSVMNRVLRLGTAAALHGDADVARQLPRLLGEVTAAEITQAASLLTPQRRAVVEVIAGGAQQ